MVEDSGDPERNDPLARGERREIIEGRLDALPISGFPIFKALLCEVERVDP